jgi:large repetitive protein
MDYQAANGREHSDDNGPRSEGSAAALTLPGLAGAVAAGAVPLTPGPDGVIVLPAGVELDDILVRGRDLVIQTGDGRVYIIVDGAVYVPTLVIDGVTVPPLNLAALLNGAEIQPAAGLNQSSGNNFAVPPGDIQDAYKIGDLLPYTDFGREPETDDEVIPGLIDREPDVLIQDGAPPSKNAEDSVSEAGLPGTRLNGNVESPGSSSADNSEATTGTIIITSPDGIASVTINGTTVNLAGGTSITTPIGRLDLGPLVSGEIGYTYTLIDNLTDNSITDVFTVIVTDPDGDSSTATLTVSIVDDVPTASPDTNTVIEGALLSVAANGVLANDTAGADGFAAGGGVVGVAAGSNVNQTLSSGVNTAIVGTYGTLTLQANGSYTYKADPNKVTANAVDRFVYTIRDGDGDPSTTTLDINVTNVTLTGANVTRTVDEAALDTVTTPPDLGNGTVTGSTGTNSGAETVTGTLSNANAAANGYTPQSVTTTYGKFQLNADGTFTYTLINPVPSGANPGPNTVPGVEQFTYTFADANGNTGTGTVTIDVIDDVATARDDGSAATPYVIAENTPLTINVLANDTFGADGQGAPAITGFTQPANGTVTLNADNTLTITPSGPGAFGPDSFTYTIKDGDGDTSTATVYLDFAADSVPNIGTPQNVTVDEDGFTGVPVSANVDKVPVQGSPAEIDSNELLVNTGKVIVAFGADKPAAPLSNIDFVNFTALDGLLKTVNGDVDFTQPGGPGTAIVGNDGTNDVIVISFTGAVDGPNPGEVEYTYQVELKQPLMHPDGNGEASQTLSGIQFQVTDSDGTQAVTPGQFNAVIFDDVPSLSVSDTPNTVVEGQLLNTGTWNQTIGADSAGAVTKVVFNATEYNLDTNIATGFGTLRVNSDGTWTFQANNNVNNNPNPTVTFTVRVTDGDLDVAQDPQTITITDGAGPSATKNATINVDEEGLGTVNATGTNDTANSENGNDTVTFQAGSDNIVSVAFESPLVGLTADVNGIAGDDIVWVRDSGTVIRGEIGGITAITITLTPPTLPITPGNSGNATVSVVLSDNFPHPNANGENNIEISGLSVIATDTDGTSIPASVTINVKDDVPINNSATLSRTVHEDALNNANAVGNNEGGKTTMASITAAALATLVTAGADAPVTISLNSAIDGALTGLEQGGTAIYWDYVSATQVRGLVNNDSSKVAFTLSWNAGTSSYDFELLDNVDHGTLLDDNGDAFTTSLSLANVFAATDSDGDPVVINAGATILIENDIPALIAATSQVAVGEDTLPGGNPDAGDAKTLTANGTLAGLVNFGADGPGSFAFDLTGQTPPALTSGGLTVKYAVSPDGLTLIGYTGATSADGQVFTVAFTNATTGAYTFTLKDQLDHLPNSPANDDNQNLTIQLSALVVAKDADGDVVRLTSGFSVLVEDDIPAPYSTAPAAVVATNTGTDYTTAPLSLNLPSIGADQPGTVAFTQTSGLVQGNIGGSPTLTTLQTGGANLSWALKAGDDTILQAKTAGGLVAFEIDLNPANGTYTFTQYEQITATQNVDILDLGSVGGGNVETRAINAPGIHDLVLSTSVGNTVNTSNSAMGVSSGQSMSGTDALRIDFVTISSVSGSGGNAVANYGSYYSVNSFKQDVKGLNNVQFADFEVRAVKVFDTGGNSPPTTSVADGDSTFFGDANDTFLPNTTLNIYGDDGAGGTNGTLLASFAANGSQTFAHETWASLGITVTPLSDGWRIENLRQGFDYEIGSTTGFQAVRVNSVVGSDTFKLGAVDLNALVIQGVSFSVPVRLSDYDGDYVDNSIPINLSAPPLVFDLNGDGAKFLSLAAGVHFAYNGVPVLTAWVDPNDGLLAIDHNGNRLVDDATELVFGGPGQTDLQGLGNYDSNYDGVIDANDADWAKFGIWQDANSNGVTDDGEFRSLDDLGIASVSLTSDGIAYSAAGGDVTVHGTASYTKADGSTGAVADAAFTLGGLQAGSDTGALDGDAMSALLAVNAAPADTQPAPDADPATVQDALADASDALTVDAVVDHFAANDSAPPPAELDGGDLMALLNTSIGSTVDTAPPPMMADSNDDHAALAAAAA